MHAFFNIVTSWPAERHREKPGIMKFYAPVH
jgi:hypothetical protein